MRLCSDGYRLGEVDRHRARPRDAVPGDLDPRATGQAGEFSTLTRRRLREPEIEVETRPVARTKRVLVRLPHVDPAQTERRRATPSGADPDRLARKRDGDRPELVRELIQDLGHRGIEPFGAPDPGIDELVAG